MHGQNLREDAGGVTGSATGCDFYYLLIVRPPHIYENTEDIIRRQVPGYREETRREITTIKYATSFVNYLYNFCINLVILYCMA